MKNLSKEKENHENKTSKIIGKLEKKLYKTKKKLFDLNLIVATGNEQNEKDKFEIEKLKKEKRLIQSLHEDFVKRKNDEIVKLYQTHKICKKSIEDSFSERLEKEPQSKTEYNTLKIIKAEDLIRENMKLKILLKKVIFILFKFSNKTEKQYENSRNFCHKRHLPDSHHFQFFDL